MDLLLSSICRRLWRRRRRTGDARDTKRPLRGCDDVVARREVQVPDGTSPAADEDENETEDDEEISGVMIRRPPTPEAAEEDAARRVPIMVLSSKSSQCLSVVLVAIVHA